MPIAIAIAAHPDDIEFRMAGTLLLLKQAGWETHYLNLSSGNCGSVKLNSTETARRRRAEAQHAAKILRAHWHPPFCRDLEIFYDLKHLRRLAAIVREVKPAVVLTHPPEDYMEDHTNTGRLAVTAVFAHGMPNFHSIPPRAANDVAITIYHATPHGLCDSLRRAVTPGLFVNTTSVHATKLAALAAHTSQQNWLDVSQGMNSYLQAMEDESLAVGKLSRRFVHAEGWWRHSHMGFCGAEADPLRTALKKNCFINQAFARSTTGWSD
ncbi:MAG: PIG-L family deacetylase [Verrucomicrobia bacterium]|nr:PIG-L family deacetylase [Verrucomicrobiota bacterium]